MGPNSSNDARHFYDRPGEGSFSRSGILSMTLENVSARPVPLCPMSVHRLSKCQLGVGSAQSPLANRHRLQCGFLAINLCAIYLIRIGGFPSINPWLILGFLLAAAGGLVSCLERYRWRRFVRELTSALPEITKGESAIETLDVLKQTMNPRRSHWSRV